MVYGKDDGMPLNYFGAFLVFIACSAVGFIMAGNYRREEKLLSELIRILDNMECEMEYRLLHCHKCAGMQPRSHPEVLEKYFWH